MRVQSSTALIAIARGFRMAALLVSRPPGKKKKRENQKPIQQFAHARASPTATLVLGLVRLDRAGTMLPPPATATRARAAPKKRQQKPHPAARAYARQPERAPVLSFRDLTVRARDAHTPS